MDSDKDMEDMMSQEHRECLLDSYKTKQPATPIDGSTQNCCSVTGFTSYLRTGLNQRRGCAFLGCERRQALVET